MVEWPQRLNRLYCWLAALLLLSGCNIQPKMEIVTGQTDMEKQLMGEFEQLDHEAILMAPVRSPGQSIAPDNIPYRNAIVQRAFRLDEINDWLQQSYLVEKLDGTVHPGTITFPQHNARLAARFHRLWHDENNDRNTIIAHWIANSKDLSSTDHNILGHWLHEARLRQLPKGALIEIAGGKFSRVE